jgi:hypothetical protein
MQQMNICGNTDGLKRKLRLGRGDGDMFWAKKEKEQAASIDSRTTPKTIKTLQVQSLPKTHRFNLEGYIHSGSLLCSKVLLDSIDTVRMSLHHPRHRCQE